MCGRILTTSSGWLLATSVLLIAAITSRADDFAIDWWTIDGGGQMWTTGGNLELSGTIGQPDAGVMTLSGGGFEVIGGFWVVATTAPEWCLGDADCSGGSPDFIDIEYFVAALTGEATWSAYYQGHHGGALPPCPYTVNDLNGGGVEFTDIEVFVQHLGQPCDPL